MALTQDQEKASEAFFNFMLTDDKFFCISGSPGVGKTYMMHNIATKGLGLYQQASRMIGMDPKFNEFVFTATTNKAAEVLEKATGVTTQTIHTYLGIKVTNDFKSKKTILKQVKTRDTNGVIIFIDEASMIDGQLYQIMRNSTAGAKIVFIGDHAQLAPVDEELSPIYKDIKPSNFVFLNQLVRNVDTPALVDLCAQLRNTVETGVFHPIDQVPGVIDYLDPAQMQDHIDTTFSQVNPSSRILCYTNQRVQTYNDYIRDMRGLPDLFAPGERVIAAKPYMNRAQGVNVSVEREFQIVRHLGKSQIGYAAFTPNQQSLYVDEYEVRRVGSDGVTLSDYSFTLPVPADAELYQATMRKIAKVKDWGSYHSLKDKVGDLRNKDACTVYKSQGSTYESVFLDLGNIGTSWDPSQVARMLFVGASRAKTRVFLYGHLPAKYCGKQAS